MFKKILVPLDGSELAEAALPPAVALAEKTGAELILLQATMATEYLIPEPAGHGMMLSNYQSLEEAQKQAKSYLDHWQERLSKKVKVWVDVVTGDPAGAIVDTAQEQNVDLIVLRSHGYSGLTRLVLGSVAERVLHEAPCPVLVLHNDQLPQHILVALDGSELAEMAIRPGVEMAKLCQANLVFFTVEANLEIPAPDFVKLEQVESGLGEQARSNLFLRGEDYLARLQKQYQKEGLEVDYVVSHGEVAEKLLAAVEANNIDLIVMVTHGRTGLKRWVYGSVTEKVLRSTPQNMLVIRPPQDLLR